MFLHPETMLLTHECRAGAKAVVLDTSPEENFCLSAETLAAALTPASRVLILCTPSNPSGTVYSLAQLTAIAAVVRAHPRLLVISDEIYEHIVYAPAQHHSFAALPDMWARTLTVNGMSKAFAMTGWRIGYLAAPAHFARAAAGIQSQSTSGACSISQVSLPREWSPVERAVSPVLVGLCHVRFLGWRTVYSTHVSTVHAYYTALCCINVSIR